MATDTVTDTATQLIKPEQLHRISLTERQIYTILFNSAGVLDLDNITVASTMKSALSKIKQKQITKSGDSLLK
jgi:hypothetical protein